MTGIRDALDDMVQTGALLIDRQRMISGAVVALDNVVLGKGGTTEQLVLAARAILGALTHDGAAAARIWDRMHAEDLRGYQSAMSLGEVSGSRGTVDDAGGGSEARQEGFHE